LQGQRDAIVCYVMLFPGNQKFIDDFFAAIAPYEAAFRPVGFSYLAIRFGGPFAILRDVFS
jgi:hypothetical protein